MELDKYREQIEYYLKLCGENWDAYHDNPRFTGVITYEQAAKEIIAKLAPVLEENEQLKAQVNYILDENKSMYLKNVEFLARIKELEGQVGEARTKLLDFQITALMGDLNDARDNQHIYDNNPNWTAKMRDEHNNYWRGQAGAIAKILDAYQSLKEGKE